MRITRRCVCTNFWLDTKIMDMLTPDERFVALWLLTNPATNMLGIYEFSLTMMASQTGFNKETLKMILRRFDEKYGIIKYSENTSEVAILNSLRYGIVGGGAPVKSCLERDEKTIKNKKLLKYVIEHLKTKEDIENVTVREYLAEAEQRLEGIEQVIDDEELEQEEEREEEQNEQQEVLETKETKPKKKAKRFVKPTVEEVQAYCEERNNNVDPLNFYDYYEARGWMLGKQKMKDWKAAVRTWERNDYAPKLREIPLWDRNKQRQREEMPF